MFRYLRVGPLIPTVNILYTKLGKGISLHLSVSLRFTGVPMVGLAALAAASSRLLRFSATSSFTGSVAILIDCTDRGNGELSFKVGVDIPVEGVLQLILTRAGVAIFQNTRAKICLYSNFLV